MAPWILNPLEHDLLGLKQLYEIELRRLRERQPATSIILALLDSRCALIEEMHTFEKSASDPRRLFQSSFRLLNEEKFRKNALPDLLRLEKSLLTAVSDYTSSICWFCLQWSCF
jgi:Microtubule associated protein (MAP65/ASE1 family)